MDKIVFLLLASAVLACKTSIASPITYRVTGELTSVARELDSQLRVGEAYEMFYTFDSLATDLNSDTSVGEYQLTEMQIDINGYFAKTVLNLPGAGSIFVQDNIGGIAFDRYTVNTMAGYGFYSHDADTINGRSLVSMVVELSDSDGSVFNSDDLPIENLPDLSHFESQEFTMAFSNDFQRGVAFDVKRVSLSIDSIELVSVSEPSVLAIFVAGLLGMSFASRRFVRSTQ